MPSPEQQYLQASDNADDYAESLLEGLQQAAREDIDDTMVHDTRRDYELWEELGVDPYLTVSDYEGVDVDERDLDWTAGLAGLSALATVQFFLDNRDDLLIKPVAYREQVLAKIEITQSQLVLAGKRGVDAVEATKAFQALRTEFLEPLQFLTQMSNSELYDTLRAYEAIRPVEQIVADQQAYVSRMTRYRPQSPQWKEAVANLVDADSKQVLQQQNRRAVEAVHSFRAADGSFATTMVWIGEGGQSTCQYCLERFGQVETYGTWVDIGLPGADVCAGGDRCRCHLEYI